MLNTKFDFAEVFMKSIVIDIVTIIVNIGVAGVSELVLVYILLVRVRHHGAVVTRISLLIRGPVIRVRLIWVVNQETVVLQGYRNRKQLLHL